jgi:hypothetical protein
VLIGALSKKRLDFRARLPLLSGLAEPMHMLDIMKPKCNLFSAAAAGVLLATLVPTAAMAQQSGCAGDFQKLMGPRQALIERINGFQKRKPTPQQACSTLGQLVAADARVGKWVDENKDWCQIPDQLVEQLKTGAGQAQRARGQACGAAKQQAAMVARARAQQRAQQGGGGAAPPVGSGVRLPSGAL